MGNYLNPSIEDYQTLLNSKVIVDKSMLISKIWNHAKGFNKYIGMFRPRRFGKSTDANMLVAYYSKGCDSHELFDNLKISQVENYKEHLNKHNVIHINMQSFFSRTKNIEDMISFLTEEVTSELQEAFPTEDLDDYLLFNFDRIHRDYKVSFIFIIDEWDCIYRVRKDDKEGQKRYSQFLSALLKDQSYVEMCYLTGILPIKKYSLDGYLNMFTEISMINPWEFSSFMGFTEDEVKDLCETQNIKFNQMKEWYGGYCLEDNVRVYSPWSVVNAIEERQFHDYWNQTETFKALQDYIDLDFEGLKDDVVKMLAGEKCYINVHLFVNDMITFHTKDAILTLLVHLGYLGYLSDEKEVYIANNELKEVFIDCISDLDWGAFTRLINNSQNILEATWDLDGNQVATYFEEPDYEKDSLRYEEEKALSYTINLAYIAAREHYTIVRELPTGKGFADIVFIPKKDKPAMIVELKYDKDVGTVISQIKNKNYQKALVNYVDNLLLVSINYDKQSKEHQCMIEKYERT